MNIWLKIRLSIPRRLLCFLLAGSLASTFAMPASVVFFAAMPKLFGSALNEWTSQHITTYIEGEIL